MIHNNDYDAKIKELEDKLITMCYDVQKSIDNAIEALSNKDKKLANEVIVNDKKTYKQK